MCPVPLLEDVGHGWRLDIAKKKGNKVQAFHRLDLWNHAQGIRTGGALWCGGTYQGIVKDVPGAACASLRRLAPILRRCSMQATIIAGALSVTMGA